MAVNKKLVLTWEGKDYTIDLNMRQIDELDDSINLMKLMNRCLLNDVRYSHAAHLVSLVLNLKGAETSQDDIYFGMFAGEENRAEPDEVVKLTTQILNACFYRSKKNITEKSSS